MRGSRRPLGPFPWGGEVGKLSLRQFREEGSTVCPELGGRTGLARGHLERSSQRPLTLQEPPGSPLPTYYPSAGPVPQLPPPSTRPHDLPPRLLFRLHLGLTSWEGCLWGTYAASAGMQWTCLRHTAQQFLGGTRRDPLTALSSMWPVWSRVPSLQLELAPLGFSCCA